MSTRKKAGLKSLEEVSSSKKKGKEGSSFVFTAEDDEEEEETSSSSSSEEESSEDDMPVTTTKKKKRVSAAKKKIVIEGDDLFSELRKSKKNIGIETAKEWLVQAEEIELMKLLLLSAGADAKELENVEIEQKKTGKATLDAVSEKLSFDIIAPIQGKTPEWKRFVASFSAFFAEIGSSTNRDGCNTTFEYCVAASVSSIRGLRHVGTVAAMYLGSGLLTRSIQQRKDLERSQKLLETEENECESKAKSKEVKDKLKVSIEKVFSTLTGLVGFVSRKPPANEAEISADDTLDEAFEPVQEAVSAWRNAGKGGVLSAKALQIASECLRTAKELRICERRALEGRDSIFHEVAKPRFRDIDVNIRAETARLLGQWSEIYTDAMCASHRSKYLGWMLSDKDEGVREAALEGLIQLTNDASAPKLQSFATRFAGRIQGMYNDSDPLVVEASLRLTRVWMNHQLLSAKENEEMISEAESLIFYARERNDLELTQVEKLAWSKVRTEAARFVSVVDSRLKTFDEDEEDENRMEVVNEKVSSVAKLRAFVDLMVRHLNQDFAHLEVTWAYEAFSEKKPSQIFDLENICDLLLDDTYCSSSVYIPRILASLLLCCLQTKQGNETTTTTTAPKKKRGKKAAGADQDAEDCVTRKIPDILVKHRSDPQALERLVQSVPYCPYFSNKTQLEKVLRELTNCITEKSLDSLLVAACTSLSALSEENRNESKQAKEAIEKACEKTSSAFKKREKQTKDESTLWMARSAALSYATTAGMEAIGGEVGLTNLFNEIAKSDSLSSWTVYAMKTAFGSLCWNVLEKEISSENASITKRNRNGLIDSFQHVLELCSKAENEQAGLGLSILSLFYDTRTLLWPGTPHIGWSPSEEMLDLADSIFIDRILPVVTENPSLSRLAYEKVLIPMSRCALYASPREDVKSAAFVLRFLNDAANTLFKKCATKLNGELKKKDTVRWLQTHLETLCLDVSYSDALSRTLGPCNEKAVNAIGKSASIMVCRAIRLAKEKSDDGLLNAVIPYLNFCKKGKAREHIVQLWEEIAPLARDESEDQEFGKRFEEKLYKSAKRVGDTPEQQVVKEKKQKNSSESSVKKRNRKDHDEEESPNIRRAKPLEFTSSTSKKKKKSAETKIDEEEEEEEDLEKSVFDNKEHKKDDDDEANMFEDDEAPSSKTTRKSVSSSTTQKKTPSKVKETLSKKVQEEEENDEEIDDDEVVGFRPKMRF